MIDMNEMIILNDSDDVIWYGILNTNDEESLHDRIQHDCMYKWIIGKVNMLRDNMIGIGYREYELLRIWSTDRIEGLIDE